MDNKYQQQWTDQLDEMASDVIKKSSRVAQKLPLLGHVCLLYSQLESHKYFAMDDIETRILPPLLTDQCKLYVQASSGGMPMGFISWAKLNAASERKYLHTRRLSPADWNSGEHIWLTDILLPYGGHDRVFNELQHSLFVGQAVNYLIHQGSGEVRRSTLQETLDAQKNCRDMMQDNQKKVKPKHH